MGFSGFCVIFVVFGEFCEFCVFQWFWLWVLCFFTALVLHSCGSYGFVLWFVFAVCVLSCVYLCNKLWWTLLWAVICDAYIICGFGFGLVGWPNPAVCVPLI